jgi:hypothetical protein
VASGMVSSASVKALAENALHLIIGLATATDDGLDSLKAACEVGEGEGEGGLHNWLHLLCLTYPDAAVRRGVCHCLFNGCANM